MIGFIQNILNGLGNILNFISLLPELFVTLVRLIPEPFRTPLLLFLTIYFLIFAYKLAKG